MEAGKDPRTDQHKGDGGTDIPPQPGTPKPAEGGLGTGTKTDPAKAPNAPSRGE
jgi:hypothetical protein